MRPNRECRESPVFPFYYSALAIWGENHRKVPL
jgi:hypothetical protein